MTPARLLVRLGSVVLVALLAVPLATEYRVLARQDGAPALTFSRDIAPIVFERCASCHRPGEAAPFSLLTYDDVRRRAQQIVEVTRRGYMPPWKPVAGYGGPFLDERRLTDEEIRTIARWVDRGAPEGDPADLPRRPDWPEDWRLGAPNLVVTMAEPYLLRADGPSVFRNFVIPIPITETKYVAGLEYSPGNARVVHHANLRIDQTPSSRELDEADPLPGYEGRLSPGAQYPDGYFLGWTPGQLPRLAPQGMAWRLDPGSDLVVQVHMQPSGRPEMLPSSIGLYFTDDPPVRTPMMLRLGQHNIDIPPGASRYVTSDHYRLPVDVEVHVVQPHAHYRAREVKGFALLPDGTKRWLIYIDDWDFNWQDVYRYAEPLALPKGTIVGMEFTYDNSEGNPRNPDRPPRRVLMGEDSTDEMGNLWIQVLTRSAADRQTLFSDFRPKMLAEDAVGYETMLLGDPEDASLHTDAALIYWDLGQADRAIAHYESAIAMEPGNVRTRYNFATLLAAQRRFDEAAAHFRQAIALRPDHAEAHNNLGAVLWAQDRFGEAFEHFSEALRLDPKNFRAQNNVGHALTSRGQVDEGIRHYLEALALEPDFADAHVNLARARASQGRFEDAVRYLREARRAAPSWAVPMTDLAWLLATAPDERLRQPDEAVRLAEQAAELTGRQNIAALDTLAASYAAVRRFEEAVAAEEAALALAVAAGLPRLADELRTRLERYRNREPFVDRREVSPQEGRDEQRDRRRTR
jgi:Tfp pilus assembly protein PilF/mono/diheme cytochrome c family protein